jgi:undecaprenyl-diphosphatase
MQTIDQILSLIGQYGYVIVFFGVLLESAGVPIPGETILLASGFMVQQGHLDLGDAIIFGTLGAVIGDQMGYWVGRKGGRPFVLRWGRYVLITSERLARAERFFERHGGKAVFLARFVAGLRVFGALVAGISRMRWRTFFLYNALGGAVWATAAVLVGYLLGNSLDLVERWMGRASILLGMLLALAIVFYLSYRWVAAHRIQLVRYRDTALSYPPVARLRLRYDRELRWLRRRLTPGQYMGLHLTLGLLAAAGCLWLFGGLAEDLLTNDPLVRFDEAVASNLHQMATPALTKFFLIITALGSVETIVLGGLLVGAFFAVRRQWLYFWTWLAALAGSAALNQLLKAFFARPRPYFEQPLLMESSYSFPSGHAMESLVFYGMLAYFAVLGLQTWRARTAVVFGAALLVLLIGFSRMYLGVHYFSDVVAGFAAGSVWLSTCITGMELVRRGEIFGHPRRTLRTLLRSKAGPWLRQRVSPSGAYGLHLTIGLVLVGLCAWAFGGVVQDVLAQDPLVRVDQAVLYFVYSHGDPDVIVVVTLFEALFSPELLLVAGIVVSVLLAVLGYRRRSFRLGFSGAVLLATVFGTGALAELFKFLFHRPRPPTSLQLVAETGYGFPSSHAVAAVAIGAVVWYIFSLRPKESWGGSWQAKAWVGFSVILLALLVGLGRVYMGAHYPSDVLAGWALGGVWASVCLTVAEVFRRLRENGSTGNGRSATAARSDRTNRPQGDLETSPRPWWRRILQYRPLVLSTPTIPGEGSTSFRESRLLRFRI